MYNLNVFAAAVTEAETQFLECFRYFMFLVPFVVRQNELSVGFSTLRYGYLDRSIAGNFYS